MSESVKSAVGKWEAGYRERPANATAKLRVYLTPDREVVSMTVTGIPEDVLEVTMSVVDLFGDRVAGAVVTTREELI